MSILLLRMQIEMFQEINYFTVCMKFHNLVHLHHLSRLLFIVYKCQLKIMIFENIKLNVFVITIYPKTIINNILTCGIVIIIINIIKLASTTFSSSTTLL